MGPFGLRSKREPRFPSYDRPRNFRLRPPRFSHPQCSLVRARVINSRFPGTSRASPTAESKATSMPCRLAFPDPSLFTLSATATQPAAGPNSQLVHELDRCVEHSGHLEYPQGKPQPTLLHVRPSRNLRSRVTPRLMVFPRA